MKVSVPVKQLIDAVRKILNVVGNRTTLPILNNVLLKAANNSLALCTSDMEVSIITTLDVEIESDGETTIPAKKFAQIIGTFTDGDVTLETDSTMTTTISCGKARFKIMGLEPGEFPKHPEILEEQQVVVNRQEFAKSLRKIAYAVSTDQSRIVLNGILLSIQDGTMTTVATDGRRLTLVEKVVDGIDDTLKSDVVLPTKVVNELQKLLDSEGEVTITLSDSYASFLVDNTVIITKLIDGKYPNYRQVIPASFKNSVVLPREMFSDVLNRVSLVIEDAGASVKFKLEREMCTLSASSPEIGEAEEPVQVTYDGEPVTISFNPAYLKDPLKNLECDDLTIRFNDEFKPVIILGDEGFLYVIMPMRN